MLRLIVLTGPTKQDSWRMQRIPGKRSAQGQGLMKITETDETEREAYMDLEDMGISETYEKAPRLAPTRLSSHARPGTPLAAMCCTSGVARCAAEIVGVP